DRWSDRHRLCRPPPPVDRRPDLIGAWQSPRLRCVDRRSVSPVASNEGTVQMIVIGADTHKSSNTLAAVDAAAGRCVATKTVNARRDGMLAAWRWAHGLDQVRVWAIEDCRHVSGRLERCLIGQGERLAGGRAEPVTQSSPA